MRHSEDNIEAAGSPDDCFTHKTLDEVIAEQNTKPLADIGALCGDFWPEEESTEEFLAQLRAWRREPDSRP